MRLPCLLLGLALGLLGCDSSGPSSAPLEPTGMTIPTGAHALDLRAESLAFALTVSGREEVHDLAGRIAPPIPGHESETIRAVRSVAGGVVWACLERAVAVYDGATWTFHDLPALSLRDLDPTGTCVGLDARTTTDAYVSMGRSVCLWDGLAWDCRQFGSPASGLALTRGHLWFLQTASGYDELTVIDTISLATPALVRLGPLGSTGHVLPVPGDDRVVVMHRAPETSAPCDDCFARTVSTDGSLEPEDAAFVLPVSRDERYVLRVAAGSPLSCGGGLFPTCGADAARSQLSVFRVTAGATREVGHLTHDGAGGVPAWAFRGAGGLLVPGEELYALP
ncbi:MAG: hypothetical protein U0234_18615 [Sandaracinus sp.]